ncbi:MAG: hypothetical protein EXR07_11870 [Acetobacteraceae bacterium]|nr:hypothetical protein [Acetobacteraceae bacterium]
MKRLGLFILCGLAILSGPVQAAQPIEMHTRTSGELADLCGAQLGSAAADAKINFCHGFAQGAIAMRLRGATDKKPFCFPNPMPSRTTTMTEFAAWVKGVPTNRDIPALDGLFRFLGERYPCKS